MLRWQALARVSCCLGAGADPIGYGRRRRHIRDVEILVIGNLLVIGNILGIGNGYWVVVVGHWFWTPPPTGPYFWPVSVGNAP